MDLWPGLFSFPSRPVAAQVMAKAVEYRQYADECLKAIWIARVPEVRTLLLSMAKLWIELAERAEEQEPPATEEITLFERKKPPAPSVSRRPRVKQAS
jgi:hypothetical protein